MKHVLVLLFFFFPIKLFAQTYNSKPLIIGYSITFHSNILSEERQLNIYFPEGYKENDTVHYPVIYLLDGGMEEDFIHTVGLVQFYNFEWLQIVPKCIVVGVVNVDRKRDFTFPTSLADDKKIIPNSGGSAKFIAFVEKELKPFIEKEYKTTNDATLIGESLGGLVATEILFKKPDLFNRYLIISPSLWWSDGALLTITPITANQPTKIFIAVGKEGMTPTKNPHVMEVDANVLVDKLKALQNPNLDISFDYYPDEDHATIAHRALMNGLKILYKRK